MENVTIAFVVPPALGEVMNEESLRRCVTSVKPLSRDETLRFGIADAANIITVVVGTIELAKFCAELARSILKQKPPAGSTVLIRTSHDDTLIRIDRYASPESLTTVIVAASTRQH